MNSVTPLEGARAQPDVAVAAAEAFHTRRSTPVLFFVPAMADDLDSTPAARGYGVIGSTITVAAPLSPAAANLADPEVVLTNAAVDR